MTAPFQAFYEMCKAKLDLLGTRGTRYPYFSVRNRFFWVQLGSKRIRVFQEGHGNLYYGSSIPRAASILFGITGNRNWLKFVTEGEKE